MTVALILGGVLIVVGAVLIRFRAVIAEGQRQVARDEARYGSLLNIERTQRELEANLTPEADRGARVGAAVFGAALIAGGVLTIVSAVFELA